MTQRPDMTDSLIHFTRGETWDAAMLRLIEIARSGVLLGSSGHIRGGFRCVCFTEAPIPALADQLLGSDSFARYSPFGVILPKSVAFARGARPVIYQSDEEFDLLPMESSWRHVRYEPHVLPPIDFTWEREWRLHSDELNIAPAEAALVLPDPDWIDRFLSEWESEEELAVEAYAAILDNLVLCQMQMPMKWRLVCLAR